MASDSFMEELSFNLSLERSIEFRLAEESEENQGRVKSRSGGLKELGGVKTSWAPGLGQVVSTKGSQELFRSGRKTRTSR